MDRAACKGVASKAAYQGAACNGVVEVTAAQVAYRTGVAATGSVGKGVAAAAASATVGLAGTAGGLAGDFAGSKIADAVGATGARKQTIENSSGFVGAIGTGATVGACVAGPAGAAAGAVLGAGGQAVGNGISAVVDCFYSDDRYEFGPGIGQVCAKYRKWCQNRGCKRCNKNYCEECYQKHKKIHQKKKR